MENTFNTYQKTIESLIEEGHTILQIFNQDGSCFYFSVLEFQESFTSPTNSVEFNAMRGVNITDFMRTQGSNTNNVQLAAKFLDYLNQNKVVRLEFSKNFKWMKWGSAAR